MIIIIIIIIWLWMSTLHLVKLMDYWSDHDHSSTTTKNLVIFTGDNTPTSYS